MTWLLLKVTNFWDRVMDIITGLFAFIPQCIYFLYTSMGSLLDLGQLVLRKLIGLDVYYIKDVDTGKYISKSGDILKEFVEGILGINNSYSALNTVFWSLIIFGVIVLVLTTIFAIIKAHYNYDEAKSQPTKIIGNSLKSLALMAITPLVVIFGVYMSEVILQSLDQITNPSSSSNISKVYESEAMGMLKKVNVNRNGDSVSDDSSEISTTYYFSYDMFGVKEWTNMTTFSGKIFEMITHDANRVRNGDYTATNGVANSYWDNCGLFYTSQEGDIQEVVASQIDFAFVNTLSLTNSHTLSIKGSEAGTVIGSTLTYGPSAAFAAGLINVDHFSKFNVGLVWYYYNLWIVNYIVGFAAVIACGMLMLSLIFGLMKRLIICVVLFIIQAPVIGISPLDGGNGFKEWKSKFLSYFIAGYGTVAGMNLFFLILPVLENISFFNIFILDKLFDIVIVIAGLTLISKMVSLVSGFIGAADLEKEGKDMREGMKDVAVGAATKTLKTANLGLQLGRYALTGGVNKKIMNGIEARMEKKRNNGFALLPPETRSRKDKKKKDKNIDMKGAIYKAVNSMPGRMLMRYSGFSDVDIFSRDMRYKKQLEEEGITDETTGKKRALSKKEIKNLVNARKIAGGQRILAGAGQNIADVASNLGKALASSQQIKPILDKLAEAGAGEEVKTGAQTLMKTIGMDTSSIETGENYYLSTAKQKEKRSKAVSKKHTEDIRNAANQSARAAGEVSTLIEILKKKG